MHVSTRTQTCASHTMYIHTGFQPGTLLTTGARSGHVREAGAPKARKGLCKGCLSVRACVIVAVTACRMPQVGPVPVVTVGRRHHIAATSNFDNSKPPVVLETHQRYEYTTLSFSGPGLSFTFCFLTCIARLQIFILAFETRTQ